jgi:hypothetical protein
VADEVAEACVGQHVEFTAGVCAGGADVAHLSVDNGVHSAQNGSDFCSPLVDIGLDIGSGLTAVVGVSVGIASDVVALGEIRF